jgi:hypothetical protein
VHPIQVQDLSTNWADDYRQDLLAAKALIAQDPSFWMAARFMDTHLSSQRSHTALLRLLANQNCNPKALGVETFAQFQQRVVRDMPDMLRSKRWNVEIMGRDGDMVPLLFAEGSPVVL